MNKPQAPHTRSSLLRLKQQLIEAHTTLLTYLDALIEQGVHQDEAYAQTRSVCVHQYPQLLENIRYNTNLQQVLESEKPLVALVVTGLFETLDTLGEQQCQLPVTTKAPLGNPPQKKILTKNTMKN